jgi:hypothetical protein
MLICSSNLSFALADSSKSNSGGGNSKSSDSSGSSKGDHTSSDTSHTPSSSSSSTHPHSDTSKDTTGNTITKGGIRYKPFTVGGPDDPILKLKKEIESVPTNVNIRIHGHNTHHLISNSNTNKELSQIQQQQINSWFTNATSATNSTLTNDTTIARPSSAASEPATTKTIPGLGF